MKLGNILANASMEKISSMESRLSGTLKPVAPRQEFVHGLGQRIQAGERTSLLNPIPSWHILAMLIGGLVSLAVLVAMVTRALVILAGKKRLA